MKYFLEIGCWQGEHRSQTFELERQGWKGLCVDPFPTNFENRTCDVCAKAVSKYGLLRIFLKVSIDRRNGGDVSYFSGFKDSLNDHLQLIKDHCDYEEVKVETITVDELFKEYQVPSHVDFLSIDTEGSELEILEAIDFSKYTFGEIVIEHNGNFWKRKRISDILKAYKLKESNEIDDTYEPYRLAGE